MTNEELDRAIAEHVGTADRWLIVKRGYFYRPEAKGYTSSKSEAWKLPLAEAKKHECLIGEERVTLSRASIPAYSTDLNAMHEAVASLTELELSRYADEVCDLAYDGHHDSDIQMILKMEARPLAECYVRAIGKWRDK